MLGLDPKWRETFVEMWPSELIELGLPLECLPLSEQDRLAIGSRTTAFLELFDIDEMPALSNDFLAEADNGLKAFDSGAHARLGGCRVRGWIFSE